jgi:hypothetical protein
MDILSSVKEKMLEYERYYGDFSEYTQEKVQNTKRWMELLAQNKIPFSGGATEVQYKSFKDIDFRGPEINNQEWRAQLNRFFWLEPIAWEYERTKDKRLAEIARESIEAWLDFRTFTGTETNASVWMTTGDNTLSTSIRLGQFNRRGWWGAVPYLNDSGYFDDAFINRMLDSTAQQMEFMKRNITPIGNWRISQLDTMFFIGFCLPGFKDYLDFAVHNINETFFTQVHDDGSHEEHTAGYHDWMKNVFTRYCYVQKARPDLGFDIDPYMLGKMWNYSLYMYAPDGKRTGLNDSGRWYELADEESVKRSYDEFIQQRSKFLKDFDLSDMDEFKTEDKPSKYFDKAGQFFMKESWDRSSTMFVFDATVWGGGHCHRARNAVNMYYNGKMLLIDPGTLNYERSDPFCHYGRSTQSHNTVSPEGMTQTINDATIEKYYEDDAISYIHSDYTGGYEGEGKSLAGSHKRTFLWIKDLGAVVHDSFTCFGKESRFSSRWQSIPGEMKNLPEEQEAHTCFDDANVLIKAYFANTKVNQKVYTGSKEPFAGWVSYKGVGLRGGEPAPMLCFETEYPVSRFELGQWIMPYDNEKPDVDIVLKNYETSKAVEIVYKDKKVVFVTSRIKGWERGRLPQIAQAGDLFCDGKSAVLIFDKDLLQYAYAEQCENLTYKGETIFKKDKWGEYVYRK